MALYDNKNNKFIVIADIISIKINITIKL